jgi:hypothetical protein
MTKGFKIIVHATTAKIRIRGGGEMMLLKIKN